MGVEGTASPEAVIAAVEAAGYGASCKGRGAGTSSGSGNGTSGDGTEADLLEDTETPVLKKRLIWSIISVSYTHLVLLRSGKGGYRSLPCGMARHLCWDRHGDGRKDGRRIRMRSGGSAGLHRTGDQPVLL